MDELPPASSRHIKPRKAVMIALWAGAGLLALATIPLLFELWRQGEINAAFEEVRHETELIAAHFENVPDINAWYVNRHPDPDGAAAVQSLMERHRATISDPRVAKLMHPTKLIADLRGEGGPLPSATDFENYLALTDPVAAELSGLVRHDVLNLAASDPEHWFQCLPFAEVLPTRAIVFAHLDRDAEATEAAVVALELSARMQWPTSLLIAHFNCSQACATAISLESVAGKCRFTPQQWQRVLDAARPRQDVLRRAAQGEAAYVTTLFRRHDFREQTLRGVLSPEDHGWFDWRGMTSGRKGTASYLRDVAAGTRTLGEVVGAAFSGAPLPLERDPRFARLAQYERTLALLLQRARAAASLNLAHFNGVDWAALTLDPAEYPDIELHRDGEALVLRFSPDSQHELAQHAEWLGPVGDLRLAP